MDNSTGCLSIKTEWSAKKRFGVYTSLFAIVAILIFLPYWSNGRSLICSGDAAVQHFPALAYYGQYLRDFLRTLFLEHRFEIQLWDMGLGYGGDIITTLHYYCLGDPLTLLSVFFPEDQTELCYTILIILRLYLSGLGMLWYCDHHNVKGYSSTVGAFIYCFSGYAVSVGVFHPFFTIPMVYLPLLLLGIDRIYERKSPLLFIISVGLSLLSNFYFFYMLVIFAVLYAILRYFHYFHPFTIKECLKWIMKFLYLGIAGTLTAMPVFLPNLISLLQSERIHVSREIPFLYPAEHYSALPSAMVSEYGEYYVYICVSAVAMVCLFLLFTSPLKEDLGSKITAIILFAFLLFPAIGSAFNGFNYVTNRWIWALTFLLAYVTAKALPKAEKLSGKQLIKLGVITVLYCLAMLLPSEARSAQTYVALGVMILCILMMTLSAFHLIDPKLFRSVIAVTVLFTVAINGYFHASPQHHNWVGNSQEAGAAYDRYHPSEWEYIDSLTDADTIRVDAYRKRLDYNGALLHSAGGTGFYFSTINPGTALFQRSQMLNSTMDQQYSGLDGRSYLAAALSVSCHIRNKDSNLPYPFGYETEVAENVYTSDHTLPLVYVFDQVCKDTENMTVTEKQQALLQCAMTDDDHGLPCTTVQYTDYNISYDVLSSDGIELTASGFNVTKAKSTLKLSFDQVAGSELYCIFEGLDFKPAEDITDTTIYFTDNVTSQSLYYKTSRNNFYSNRHDFLVNMGYQEESRTELVIYFPWAGEYTFSEFSLVAQPMDDFTARVDALSDSGISEIAVNGDTVSFSSERTSPGMACIAIPYQKGWKATVDGKDAEVLNIQDGLCGLYLEEGQHEIVMEYTPPCFALSYCLFALGALLIAVSMRAYLRRKSAER